MKFKRVRSTFFFEILVGRKKNILKTQLLNFLIYIYFKNLIFNNFKFKGDFLMTAAYLPSILVPLVGLVFPAIAMTSIFMYIEKQEIN